MGMALAMKCITSYRQVIIIYFGLTQLYIIPLLKSFNAKSSEMFKFKIQMRMHYYVFLVLSNVTGHMRTVLTYMVPDF